MAPRTDITESAPPLEIVFVTAAPRTNQHALSYHLAAVAAFMQRPQHLFVAFNESLPPHLKPVAFELLLRLYV